jgi:transcriptional regulator with XRE-family HTH domain
MQYRFGTMAQKPAKRHVLADVRIELGLSQAELASILVCATATVQRIEQGTLALSEKIALQAQETLNVSAAWLLANNPGQAPITPPPEQKLWNRLSYELAGGARDKKYHKNLSLLREADKEQAEIEYAELKTNELSHEIWAMLYTYRGDVKQAILVHRLHQAVRKIRNDFPPSEVAFDYEQRQRLQRARDEKDLTHFRFIEQIEKQSDTGPAVVDRRVKKKQSDTGPKK